MYFGLRRNAPLLCLDKVDALQSCLNVHLILYMKSAVRQNLYYHNKLLYCTALIKLLALNATFVV